MSGQYGTGRRNEREGAAGNKPDSTGDADYEGRLEAELDIDRMVNEGLGGGMTDPERNGRIGETTTDTMNGASGGG